MQEHRLHLGSAPKTWQTTFDSAAEAGDLMLRVLTEGFGHDPADRFDIERY